jgi:hypothetical protein
LQSKPRFARYTSEIYHFICFVSAYYYTGLSDYSDPYFDCAGPPTGGPLGADSCLVLTERALPEGGATAAAVVALVMRCAARCTALRHKARLPPAQDKIRSLNPILHRADQVFASLFAL